MKKARTLIIICTVLGTMLLSTGTFSYLAQNTETEKSSNEVTININGYNEVTNKEINIVPAKEGEIKLNLNIIGSGSDVIYKIEITEETNELMFYYDSNHKHQFVNHAQLINYNANMTDTLTIYWQAEETIKKVIKVNLKVTIEEQIYGTMHNGSLEKEAFWQENYLNKINKIYFIKGTKEVPSICNETNLCWDISENKNQIYHVYAYLVSEFDNYNLYIACTREIYIESCENLFKDIISLITIEFKNNLNSIKVKNMQSMFENCQSLKKLNLNIHTSNVTNMEKMFYNCISLEKLNISSFTFSKVETYANIFIGTGSTINPTVITVFSKTEKDFINSMTTNKPYVWNNNIIIKD